MTWRRWAAGPRAHAGRWGLGPPPATSEDASCMFCARGQVLAVSTSQEEAHDLDLYQPGSRFREAWET